MLIVAYQALLLLFIIAGKLETFETDESVVLHQLAVKNITNLKEKVYIYRRPNEKSHATSHSYADLWNSVPSHYLEELQNIYKYDCLMFDYPTDPFQ